MTVSANGQETRDRQDVQAYTPDKVRNAEFSRAPLTRRGYHEDEVRIYLHRVAEVVAASDAEKSRLRGEIQRLRDYFREHGVGAESSSAPAQQQQEAHVEAINVMSRAQQSADTQVAQAEEYARRIVSEARGQHEQILQQAQREATEAAERARLSQQAAGHSDAGEREQLERHLAYLRTFAEVTQVQLKSVLEGLSREVDKLETMPSSAMIRR